MKTITTDQIKNVLDEILSEYLATDKEIQDGLSSTSEFFSPSLYSDLTQKKEALQTAFRKLTEALTAIHQYM